MQGALDIAAYALGATVLVGLVLLGALAFDMAFGLRFRTPHPEYVRLPCTALDAARGVYAQMKQAYAASSPRERRLLDVHLRRMEERVQHLEEKSFDEQAPYYKYVGRREKLWRGSKALHDQVRQMTRANRRRAQHLLEETSATYRLADEGVKEEWERGVLRDKLMLEELRSVGVLDETYLPKLLAQVKDHAAKSAPVETGTWQEPGVEDDAAPNAGGPAVAASRTSEPDETLEDEPPSDSDTGADQDDPGSFGAATYNRIRHALAPLFGTKQAASALRPVAVEAPTIPESAWTPAPPPPRVALPVREAAPAPLAAAPKAGAGAATVEASVAAASVSGSLRQQDLLGDGISAPGRQYTDPTFEVAGLPRGILHQADFSGTRFAGVRFTGRHRYLDCRFAGADLSAVQLAATSRAHQFVRCDFTGAHFDASRIGFALFHECNLSNTRWTGARLERVRFSECALEGVSWDGAEFVETRILSMAPPSATDTALTGAEESESADAAEPTVGENGAAQRAEAEATPISAPVATEAPAERQAPAEPVAQTVESGAPSAGPRPVGRPT
jgi:hypothetical protein